MKPDPTVTCHETGHKSKCLKHYMNCPKWIRVQGKHPQTGKETDEYACADTWTPVLQMELIKSVQSNQAAIESFRNQMNKDNARMITQQINTLDKNLKLIGES